LEIIIICNYYNYNFTICTQITHKALKTTGKVGKNEKSKIKQKVSKVKFSATLSVDHNATLPVDEPH